MDLITVTRKDGLEFSIRVRGHEVTSDMSEKDGGRDAGPSPVELLAGSLGACIAMMVQSLLPDGTDTRRRRRRQPHAGAGGRPQASRRHRRRRGIAGGRSRGQEGSRSGGWPSGARSMKRSGTHREWILTLRRPQTRPIDERPSAKRRPEKGEI